jgi:hypothetical protein
MRTLPVVLVFAVVIAALAPVTAADQPVVSQYPVSGSGVWSDMCPFSVYLETSANVVERQFFDKSGALTMTHMHWVEQDTFSANGKSLIGVPYTFNIQFLINSSGNITRLVMDGILEKVQLPDGKLFMTVGRYDVVANDFPEGPVWRPDKGATVNLGGFCRALAP